MFEWLTEHVSDSPLSYVVVLVATAADVLLPLIPAETVVIAASVLAANGALLLPLIVLAAALGAIAGDNAVYFAGRRYGGRAAARLLRSEKGERRLAWAERQLRLRGPLLIVAGRFVPGGRTATTLAAGSLGMAYRRFLTADVAAALIWAVYISMLGYLGGAAFEDNLWLPLGIAFGAALLVGVFIEAGRRIARRRGGGRAERPESRRSDLNR